MKNSMKFSSLLLASLFTVGTLFTSCSNDDDPIDPASSTPTISGVAPTAVAIGDEVTISGTNLDQVTAVGFGTSAENFRLVQKTAFVLNSATAITVTVPEGVTFPSGLAVLIGATPIAWQGTLTEREVVAEVPTPTTTVAGTLTGTVLAVFAPSATPGREVVFQVSNDVSALENDDVTVTVGENNVVTGSWFTKYEAGGKGITASFPTNVEIGENYKFTISLGGTAVGTAVVKADLVIFGFAKPEFDWNEGGGTGSYGNFSTYRSVIADAPSTDYYYHLEVEEMPLADDAWGVIVNESANGYIPNALITDQDGIALRVRVGATTGADVILRFHLKANDIEYNYDWAVAETEPKDSWIDVFFPFSEFFYWNAAANDGEGVNETLSENIPDIATATITKWGITNGIALWDAKGGFGEGQTLILDVDNVRFAKQQ